MCIRDRDTSGGPKISPGPQKTRIFRPVSTFFRRFVRGVVPGSILGRKIDEKSIKNWNVFSCFFGSLRLRFRNVRPSRYIAIYSTLSTFCFYNFFSYWVTCNYYFTFWEKPIHIFISNAYQIDML